MSQQSGAKTALRQLAACETKSGAGQLRQDEMGYCQTYGRNPNHVSSRQIAETAADGLLSVKRTPDEH